MANNLGSLIVSLGLDAAEFTKGMSKSEYEAFKSTEKIKSQFMALGKYVAGLGIGAALVQSIRSTADYADEIGKLAQRAGTSAEDISKLAYAARQADVDNGQLAKGLRALGEDALTGGEKLAALGIKTTDASGKAKSSAQLFSEVADKIADMEDPQKKAAAAAELLGSKLGPELIPLLNQGAAGLKSSADEAARFGRVVNDDAVKAAETFNDNMTKLQEAGTGLATKLAGPVVQSLADASSYFIKVANDVGIARASLITFGAAFARAAGLDDVGRMTSQAKANSNAIALTVKQIETFQRLADAGDAGAATRVAQLRQQYEKLQTEGQKITSLLKTEAADIEASFTPVKGSPLESNAPRSSGGGNTKASSGSPAKVVDPDALFKAYLANLQKQIDAAQEMGVVENTLRDIQLGRIGIVDEAQRESLLTAAAQIAQMERSKTLAQQQADEQKKAAEAQRALQEAGLQVFEETRTAQEQLIARLAEIDRLQKAGAISAETAGRAAAKAYGDAAKVTKELTEEEKLAKRYAAEFKGEFQNTAEDVIFNSANASDAVRNLGEELLKIILRQQLIEPFAKEAGNLLAGLVVSAIGGGTASYDGGGYTGSGARSGGVDGKGGFPAILHPNETVIDHTRGQSMGGSVSVSYTINAPGADPGSEMRIKQEIKASEARVKNDILASMNKGGTFARASGRA